MICIIRETQAIGELFEIDLYTALSAGALILAAHPQHVDAVLAAPAAQGIPAAVVGELTPLEAGRRLVRGSEEIELVPPAEDPYWGAFWRAIERGWR